MKTDTPQEFVLKSEHNLHIAAAVHEAFPKARERIVSGLLERLDSRLKKKLKGWDSERYGGQFFIDAYAGYYFWKPAWKGQYGVGLQCNEHGERIVFGVYREKDHIGKRPFSPELLSAIADHHPSARTNAWWEARMTMRFPVADWRKPEVLWRMHTDATFVDDVAEQLLQVAEISEPIIDRLARKKQPLSRATKSASNS